MDNRTKNINDNLEILRIGEFKLLLEKELYPVTIPKLCKDITNNIPGSSVQLYDKINNSIIIKIKKRREDINIVLANIISDLIKSNMNYIYYAYDASNIEFKYLTDKTQIINLPLYQLFSIYFLSDLLIRIDL